MGGHHSKWQTRRDIPQGVDVTGQYEATGDIFNDILRSCQLTDSERRQQLKIAKENFPPSYKKRFGSSSIDQILQQNRQTAADMSPAPAVTYGRERLAGDQFRLEASTQTGEHLIELLADVMRSETLSNRKKSAFLGRFETVYPGIVEELKKTLRMEGEAEIEIPDSGPGGGASGEGDCGEKTTKKDKKADSF